MFYLMMIFSPVRTLRKNMTGTMKTSAEHIIRVIQKSEILKEQEKEIRISPDNNYEYKPNKDDDPDLDLLKEALAAKKCDIDKYEDKFNGNYANDKRVLNTHSITSKKLKRFALFITL